VACLPSRWRGGRRDSGSARPSERTRRRTEGRARSARTPERRAPARRGSREKVVSAWHPQTVIRQNTKTRKHETISLFWVQRLVGFVLSWVSWVSCHGKSAGGTRFFVACSKE